MKKPFYLFLILFCPLCLYGQNIEVSGGIIVESIDVSSGLIKNLADPISTQDAATKSYVDQLKTLVPTYSVGDFAQGGIVFWVDETGQHGLVCTKGDQSSDVRWYAGTNGNTRAKGDGVYAGKANTSIIISSQVAIGDDGAPYAAQLCNDLQITEGGTTYDEWYLPSKYELNLMYQSKAIIDNTALANGGSTFSSLYYWTSTESVFNGAWLQRFGNGVQDNVNKSAINYVRAVRAF